MKGCFIFYLLSAILAILFNNENDLLMLLFFLIICLFVFYKFNKKNLIYLLIFFVFFAFYRTNNKYNISTDFQKYTLKIKTKKENYCLVEDNNKNIYLLYQQENIVNENDIISLKGELTTIPKDSNLYGFEFKQYLKNQRVFYMFDYYIEFKVIKNGYKLNEKLIDNLTSKLDSYGHKITNMLLFNNKDVDTNFYENIQNINASHLFVVSGFHILFFYQFLTKIFSLFLKKHFDIPIFIILFFYLFLLDFSISSLRAFICLYLPKIDKNKKLNSWDYLGIAGLITLIIEPLNIYNYSFIMSYLATFFLLLSHPILKNKSKIYQCIFTSFICFLCMLPIVLYINYKINFISFFTNILLSYFVIIIFVLSLVGLIFSIFNLALFESFYKLFINFINKLSSFGSPMIFGCPSKLFVFIFYSILIYLIYNLAKKNYKYIYISLSSVFSLLFIKYNQNEFINYEQVTFLDVYQGDCCIIENKYNEGVIFIDTGGLKNYDLVNKRIIPYLEYKGIRTIDTIIISHPDYDHMGAINDLINSISVKNIINNSNMDIFEIGRIKFKNLNVYSHLFNNTNNQSLVLKTTICNMIFLFTGDIDSSIEEQIIKDNPNLSVDILKVAHHGSKYSSSDLFLKKTTPKLAVISVGKNNLYGHPHIDVINRFKKNKIPLLRTDIHGSIYISFKFNKYYLKTAK